MRTFRDCLLLAELVKRDALELAKLRAQAREEDPRVKALSMELQKVQSGLDDLRKEAAAVKETNTSLVAESTDLKERLALAMEESSKALKAAAKQTRQRQSRPTELKT